MLLIPVLLSHRVAAECKLGSCMTCTEQECNTGTECYDTSPGDYDPQYCLDCDGGNCHYEGGGDMALNPDLGCSGEDNIIVALLMGILGGSFACILPCCGLCYRSQRKWAEDFLSAPADKVSRTQAGLQRKWIETSSGESRSTSYMFEIQFFAQRRSGETYKVCGKVTVMEETYNKQEQGAQIEVAYRVGNEGDFILVEDVSKRSHSSPKMFKCLLCAFGAFMMVGLLVGVASFPLSGCFLGLIPFILLIIGGALAGRFLCFPLARKISQSSFYVIVTPCSPVERPVATSIGVAAAAGP